MSPGVNFILEAVPSDIYEWSLIILLVVGWFWFSPEIVCIQSLISGVNGDLPGVLPIYSVILVRGECVQLSQRIGRC